jgi:hypothetical protein
VTFTKALTEKLRVLHEMAVERGDDTFELEGETLDTNYAKYLLEYLDSVGLSV